MQVSAILDQLQQQELEIMELRLPWLFNFYSSKSDIDSKSALFPLLQRMPKGGALHLHFAASSAYDWFVSVVTYEPNCYIYVIDPNAANSPEYKQRVRHLMSYPYAATSVGTTTFRAVNGTFAFFATQPDRDGLGSWEEVNYLRNQSGNATLFDQQLLTSLTLKNHDETMNYFDLWANFTSIFGRVSPGVSYVAVLPKFFRNILMTLVNDGVQHAEFRIGSNMTCYDLDGTVYPSRVTYKILVEEVQAFQKLYPNVSVSLICEGSKRFNIFQAEADISLALELKKEFPQYVVGYDLSGPEDDGNSLLYFSPLLLEVADVTGGALSYYLHAGETSLTNNTNLLDALLLNTKRFAHGFDLWSNPLLLKMAIEQNISAEVCPISNQVDISTL